MSENFSTNAILYGDTLEIMPTLPPSSIDLIFADPPYNLQLQQELWRPNLTQVDAVDDEWDQFDSFNDYDNFTRSWLMMARDLMKDTASIWVSGTYHNIFRVGAIMQDLGFWMLNTVTWYKTNAMPNFRGTRLKNDVEFVIWAKKSQNSRYTFNHHQMKQFNNGKQLGSVWTIPACGGEERLKDENGKKLHSTQKPEELLKRIIIASSKPGDIVFDPFMGTGTTAAMAKYLHRQWLGIERDKTYLQAACSRVNGIQPIDFDDSIIQDALKKKPKSVSFKTLLDHEYLEPGQELFLDKPENTAVILDDGKIKSNGFTGSIHQVGAHLKEAPSCNGWTHWYYIDGKSGEKLPIDVLRENIRRALVE